MRTPEYPKQQVPEQLLLASEVGDRLSTKKVISASIGYDISATLCKMNAEDGSEFLDETLREKKLRPVYEFIVESEQGSDPWFGDLDEDLDDAPYFLDDNLTVIGVMTVFGVADIKTLNEVLDEKDARLIQSKTLEAIRLLLKNS